MADTVMQSCNGILLKLFVKIIIEDIDHRVRREPGNMNLQRGKIFGLFMFKRRVSDQGVGPAGQKYSGAGSGERFQVPFKIIEQDQVLA